MEPVHIKNKQNYIITNGSARIVTGMMCYLYMTIYYIVHRSMFIVENEEDERKKGKILQVELFIRVKQAML